MNVTGERSVNSPTSRLAPTSVAAYTFSTAPLHTPSASADTRGHLDRALLAGGQLRHACRIFDPMSQFSVSAATVTVDDEGRVLLIRRADNDQWQIPGGVVEIGEQPVDAAVRETIEESGITPANLQLSGVYTNVARGIVAFVFKARIGSGELTLSDESVDAQFVDADKAVGLVPEIFNWRIKDALTDTGVTFRAHDGARWV